MVGEKRSWVGQLQEDSLMMGRMRVKLKGCYPCYWVGRMTAVQKKVMFRIEMKVHELAQAVAVELGC